jgi:hypothetical protein
MIVRLWRGVVPTEKIAEYAEIVERTGISGYRQTPGNVRAELITRNLGGGRSEIMTLSWWHALEDIRAFAGDDIEVAKYYPEDDGYLLDRDRTVAHYEVFATGRPTSAGGGS